MPGLISTSISLPAPACVSSGYDERSVARTSPPCRRGSAMVADHDAASADIGSRASDIRGSTFTARRLRSPARSGG